MTDNWWHPTLHGLVVVRDGETVFERYGEGEDETIHHKLGRVTFSADTLHDIRSITKSVVGLLYGIALAEGGVPAPHEPLMAQFPEYSDVTGKDELTVEHALTMTLGLEWNEDVPYTSEANSEVAMELAPDRYRYVLERPVAERPGTRWHYCGGATALVARIVEKGTGQPLRDFARSRLFEPLGIERFEWTGGPDGGVYAASGLRLRPRDLARIGQAVLGKELPWPGTLFERHVTIDADFWYGYQWFLGPSPQRWLGGFGNGGQRLLVFPDSDLVVVTTGGLYNLPIADQQASSELIFGTILPAMAR
ncbi:serine hydrolase domain-containing protein [Thermoactinospora rubra]|uniref:serine hydrolase domain-containing protein n=1 Tax=Thermoactinospora rubra TaxID=1088767 RepID=UPI000A1008DD|nr:serine hydrolase domain-containing protein [Thermoactinospora rubra]